MLSFVQSWFTPPANAIGVDFGTDCLRLAQVDATQGDCKLVAAASCDVPQLARNDPAARVAFFTEALRDLLSEGNFRGRRATLALPASLMHILHLRMPRMEEDALRKALPWEVRGKLPIDPSQAVMRHLVAGEVYHDQEPKSEVIVMAARRDLVEQLLEAAAKAKLDVVGMNTEPKAVIDCFSRLFRRKSDAEATTCYLDMGAVATRALIARGQQILFARTIPIGGEHFSRAVSASLKIPLDEAKVLRVQLAAANPVNDDSRPKPAVAPEPASSSRQMEQEFALLGAALSAAQKREPQSVASPAAPVPAGVAAAESMGPQQQVEAAYREPLSKLVEELQLCRRYYEATFPNKPIDRLLFLGGEARHRSLCHAVAREMGIAAQIGDPMVRMSRTTEVSPESGIDRRLPQPAWAVAIGLSLGPVAAEQPAAVKE